MNFFQYFQSYNNYFWEWDISSINTQEENFIATLCDGKSIAYLEQLVSIVKDLSHQGVPTLGSLLLVLSAINENINTSDLNTLFETLKAHPLLSEVAKTEHLPLTISFLNLLRELPKNYTSDSKMPVLIQTLFYNCHNRVSEKKAEKITTYFSSSKVNLDLLKDQKRAPQDLILTDLKVLALLAKKFTSTDLILQAMANLQSPPNEALQLEENSTDVKKPSLIDELNSFNSTYQTGSLIKQLWSGLKVPMQQNIPSGQPLGGVSDITNKGEFDRLLISEFANSNTTFLSRIVNGEALYIEREAPPQNAQKNYVFLIDASIKNWGVPKVLSFASAISIHTHPKNDINYSAYVLGEAYSEVNLHSVTTIIDAQNITYSALDCSEGLLSFFKDFNRELHTEVFLITSEEALNSKGINKVMQQHFEDIQYLITTHASGTINFYKHKGKNRKHLQQLYLPYEDIWSKNKPDTSVRRQSYEHKDLHTKYPLLHPINKSLAVFLPFLTEMFVIQNGNLYSFTSKDTSKGLQLIYENLPYTGSRIFTVIRNSAKELLCYAFDIGTKTIHMINTSSKEHQEKKIDQKNMYGEITLFNHANQVYLSHDDKYISIDQVLGSRIVNASDSIRKKKLLYKEKQERFRHSLKKNKVSYNPLSKLKTISIDHSKFLNFNSFYLLLSGLKERGYYNSNNANVTFTPRVTLILKKPGSKTLQVVKVLKTELNLSLTEANALIHENQPILAKDITEEEATILKNKIEDAGAICYFTYSYFLSEEGSKIYNRHGILYFISSHHEIPTFYVTSVVNYDIAMASPTEFAGNTYFLPEKNTLSSISVDEFHKKYINPFIDHIINHATTS